MEKCDWNPEKNEPALCGEPFHGYATLCVGSNGTYHLCKSCSELPRFKRYKKSDLPEAKRITTFNKAPLGARFQYASDGPDGKIWVKVSASGYGVVAEYHPELIMSEWAGQRVCSALPGDARDIDIVIIG